MLAGCISPNSRDLARDDEIQGSYELLQPAVRGPVDSNRDEDRDPTPSRLEGDVLQLSSPIPLERIQANNRLKQAESQGTMIVARFVAQADAASDQLVAAIRFLIAAEFETLESDDQSTLREALAVALGHDAADVRVEAARALRVHGPGVQRTTLLAAIGDPERRVRWAVVRHFSDHPEELDKPQRSLLLTYLDAGSRSDFQRADQDGDGQLTRSEFRGVDEQFRRLDRDGNGTVSLEEWVSPVPGEIRADVMALLMSLHAALTPDQKPAVYNPWLPASDQLERVAMWRAWNEEVSGTENPDENEG